MSPPRVPARALDPPASHDESPPEKESNGGPKRKRVDSDRFIAISRWLETIDKSAPSEEPETAPPQAEAGPATKRRIIKVRRINRDVPSITNVPRWEVIKPDSHEESATPGASEPLSELGPGSQPPPPPGSGIKLTLRTANINNPKKGEENGVATALLTPPRTPGIATTDFDHHEESDVSKASTSPLSPLSDWTPPPYPGSGIKLILRTANVNPRSTDDSTNELSPLVTRSGRRFGKHEYWGGDKNE